MTLARIRLALLSLPLVAPLCTALAQTQPVAVWPTRPVKILVGFPGGSTPDMSARALADALGKTLGQPVIVENKPGASGNIAADMVAKATDDHTLGVVINGNLTSAKMLFPKLPFDPLRDFAPISLLTTAPLVLVTTPDASADFLAAARQGGDKWNYGSVGNGSVGHLGMELLKAKVPGMTALHVPYPGNPQIAQAMLAGQVHVALLPPGVAMPHARAGKLRAVGLTGGRSTLVPDVAPLSDMGIKGFELEVWTALVGPAKLSATARKRLAAEVPAALRDAQVRQRLFNQGWNAVGTSPEGLLGRMRSEAALMGNIIAERGIKIE